MATLLDFFKKIPSEKATNSSPIAADTAEGGKSTSPQEKAKVLTPNSGKINKKISVKVEKNSHVKNGESGQEPKGLENHSPKQEMISKRAISDDDSDDDVTGRKVSDILHKHHLFLFNIKMLC